MLNARKAIARLAIVALPIAGLVGAGAVHAASAQPKGNGGSKGCDVENVDSHGNTVSTSKVPEGTRIGMFVCGADGEWHFGWLIDGIASQPKGHGKAVSAAKVDARTLAVTQR